MAKISHWRCNRCGVGRSVRTGDPRYYGRAPDAGIPCRDQIVWCRACADLRPAELLEDLRTLRLQSDLAMGRDPGMRSDLTCPPMFQALIEWRRRRQSPEKCLTCGSIRIVRERTVEVRTGSFESLVPAVPHPGCGGLFLGSRTPDTVPDVAEWVPDEGPGPVCRPWWRFW